ncbi:MAG: hypothetical protein WC661_14085 [Opitutaceae bacterium]|jgi:hypothetical protein
MLLSPILPGTSANIARWIETAKSQPVGAEDKALIDSGTPEGRRRYLVILFAESFLTLDCSFHATVRDYCTRIIAMNLGFHEAKAVALFLDFVMPHVPDMVELEFIDLDLAEQLSGPAVTTFLSRFA